MFSMATREKPATTPVGFRLPDSLIARLDAFCAAYEREHAGMRLSRSNAIRFLLEQALTAAGYPAEAKRRK